MMCSEKLDGHVEAAGRGRFGSTLRFCQSALLILALILTADVQAQDLPDSVEPSATQQDLEEKANQALEQENYEKALTLSDAALAVGDLNTARLLKATALAELGRCAEAEEELSAIADAPVSSLGSADDVARQADTLSARLDSLCPGQLIVECGGAVVQLTVDGTMRVTCDEPTSLEPGTHTLEMEAAGESRSRRFTIAPRETLRIDAGVLSSGTAMRPGDTPAISGNTNQGAPGGPPPEAGLDFPKFYLTGLFGGFFGGEATFEDGFEFDVDIDGGFTAILDLDFGVFKYFVMGLFLQTISTGYGDAGDALLLASGLSLKIRFGEARNWEIRPGATIGYQHGLVEDGDAEDDSKGLGIGAVVEGLYFFTPSVAGVVKLGFSSQVLGGNDDFDITWGPLFYLAGGVTFAP